MSSPWWAWRAAQFSNDEFRKKVHDAVGRRIAANVWRDELWEWFSRALLLFCRRLRRRQALHAAQGISQQGRSGSLAHQNFFYYLAHRAEFFGPIVQKLSAAGLMEQANSHWRRVVIEKPFGHDLESAKALNQELCSRKSTKNRFIASITISAKRPCRTSWRSASPTEFLSPLEPPLYRPRADFRGRNGRSRRARKLF